MYLTFDPLKPELKLFLHYFFADCYDEPDEDECDTMLAVPMDLPMKDLQPLPTVSLQDTLVRSDGGDVGYDFVSCIQIHTAE